MIKKVNREKQRREIGEKIKKNYLFGRVSTVQWKEVVKRARKKKRKKN